MVGEEGPAVGRRTEWCCCCWVDGIAGGGGVVRGRRRDEWRCEGVCGALVPLG